MQCNEAGLLVWAPQDSDALQRLVSACLQHVTNAHATCSLQLLVPHDPFPDCDSPGTIRDLWWHPHFSDK